MRKCHSIFSANSIPPPGDKCCAQETHIPQRLVSHESLVGNDATSLIPKSVVLKGGSVVSGIEVRPAGL